MSIDHLAERTRIPTAVLNALESNAFDDIPGGNCAVRGHLRTTGTALELDIPALLAALDRLRPPTKHHPIRQIAALQTRTVPRNDRYSKAATLLLATICLALLLHLLIC